MKAFTLIPFFRIIIPFLLGILISLKFDTREIQWIWFLALLTPITFLNFYAAAKKLNKWLFLFLADLFFISFGASLVQQKNSSKQVDFYGNKINTDSIVSFIAVVNDLPLEKEKFIKCELKFLEVKSVGTFQKTSGIIYGYFKKSLKGSMLKPGQTLLIKTKLLELSPPKNPFEFNYQSYLYNKQIYHSAFIDSLSYWELPLETSLNSIWLLGLRSKAFVLNRLKSSQLSKNAYGICAALLTGYDDEIERPVIEAFSHSGTLHVLSVSGLHTGLIYLVINFLLDFFDRKRKYKLSRFIFITLILWFFALITGFSAPVLRAVIMFNLLGFGKIYFRAQVKHQLNILLVSAFVLLIYNPYYICDVGFLLSYFALFGLIYFQPKFSELWIPDNVFLNSTWQSVTASIAATLSTLPITLFYFKQFPLWFFVCNVVVVPATFVLLFMALFVVFKVNFMALLINYFVVALIWFIDLFNSQRFGFIDTIDFTFKDAVFLSILILLLSVAFQYRSYKLLVAGLLIVISWQFFALIDSYNSKNKSLLTIYNVKKTSVCSVKNRKELSISQVEMSTFNFSIKPHLSSFNYPEINYKSFNAVKTEKDMVLFLDKPGFWPYADLKKVTLLILANNFKLYKEDLKKFENLRTIVADASNNNYQAVQLAKLSSTFGIDFYNTKLKGAYLLALP